MSYTIKTLSASALLFALCASALAQNKGLHAEGPRAERSPIVISEAREHAIARAAKMDLDGDGFISMEERKAFHEARRAERMQQRMSQRGINPDANISVEDFVARRVAWLKKLDTNGDGVVDREEMRAARDGHGPRRGIRGKGEGKRHGKHHE